MSSDISLAYFLYKSSNFKTPEEGDLFFQSFGPGNLFSGVDRPFERYKFYEEFLKRLYEQDPNKFQSIHKGTPFYFMAWTAFQSKRYVDSCYYMDRSLSEDIRKTIEAYRKGNSTTAGDDVLSEQLFDTWKMNPSCLFLMLERNPGHQMDEALSHLESILEKTLANFRGSFTSTISVQNLKKAFLRESIIKSRSRSLVTAFLSFMLEADDVRTMLILKGRSLGSIHPILQHLLKGTMILETILKQYYSADNLGKIYKDATFQSKYAVVNGISAKKLSDILKVSSTNSVEVALKTTGMIRNTTAHNLEWDDIFDKIENYEVLYSQVVNSIILAIKTENGIS